MKLKKFKEKNNYTYRSLAEFLGLERSKTYRICADPKYPSYILLKDAIIIQSKTKNEVTLEELCK